MPCCFHFQTIFKDILVSAAIKLSNHLFIHCSICTVTNNNN